MPGRLLRTSILKRMSIVTAVLMAVHSSADASSVKHRQQGHHHQHGLNEGYVEIKTNDLRRRPAGPQGDPALIGQWSAPFSNPAIAIHTSVLPTGKVLMFSYNTGNPAGPVWLWNPESGTSTAHPVADDIFCAGHAFLSDGRLLVAGGNGPAPPNEFRGLKCTYIFDPFAEEWTKVEDMADGRWYPTCLPLSDGRIVTVSGLDENTGAINADVEIYEDGVGWTVVAQASLPLYPLLLLTGSGDVFIAGPGGDTPLISSQTWSMLHMFWTNFGWRTYPTWVPLPKSGDRVLITGGSQNTVTPTAEIMDLNVDFPAWEYTQSMNFPRVHANAVILPDATVLVVGGQSTPPFQDTIPYAPVYDAELYRPRNGTWEIMAAQQIPRLYHSSAVLLPDGRVLSGGTDGAFELEIYSPPYLFKGARPAITQSPQFGYYGSSIQIEVSSQTVLNSACLIRLSSVTHSTNMEQRYVDLGGFSASVDPVSLSLPASSSMAPAGYYMLFVIDSTGVPSESRMIRLMEGTGCGCDCHTDPICDNATDILDVVAAVDIAFRGQPVLDDPNPSCPYKRTDVDCSNATDVLDVVRIVNVTFRGGDPTGEYCSPCP